MKLIHSFQKVVAFSFLFAVLSSSMSAAKAQEVLFVASKTNGICRYDVAKDGSLANRVTVADVANPQFLAEHPSRPLLYMINNGTIDEKKKQVISAFSMDKKTKTLTLLNQQPAIGGATHLSVDRAGKNVLVANYGGGSICVFPIQSDGSLGAQSDFVQHTGSSIVPKRQEGPHAHQILTDATDRFVLVCDLGLDKVLIYRLDAAKGKLTPNDPPFATLKPGAGPRHLAFHPNNRFVYLINELNSTMTVFSFDAKTGSMKQLQTVSTLPEGFTDKNSTAEVYVHPSGKYLYGSNRGHDSIVVFGIDKEGRLSLLQHQSTMGKTPRHFAIDREGKFLCAENQDSENVVTYQIDAKTGLLKPTGTDVKISSPSCALFYNGR